MRQKSLKPLALTIGFIPCLQCILFRGFLPVLLLIKLALKHLKPFMQNKILKMPFGKKVLPWQI